MSFSSTSMPLRDLYGRALQYASKTLRLSTMEDETQNLAMSCLRDLETLSQAIDTSGMFSPNESLEDIATRHLPYLLVQYVMADMEGRLKTLDREKRIGRLRNSQRRLQLFFHWVRQYEIIPGEEDKLCSKRPADIKDPAKRRELKIKQFQAEKDLRGTIDIIRKRRGQSVAGAAPGDDFELIASMLPTNTSDAKEQTDDDDDDDAFRPTYLLIIRLIWVQAQAQLESMEMELELLRNAPLPERQLPRPEVHGDETWRLDTSIPRGGLDGKGPLMDSSGRPLRPFTILPGSMSSERSRMQAQVFRPDHRLPTMSMDDYLEEERRRGNIITGGGPQSQHAPTRSEQLALDSEMDGSVQGELRADEKREEDERWARYTDLHPKGEGNTMNRG